MGQVGFSSSMWDRWDFLVLCGTGGILKFYVGQVGFSSSMWDRWDSLVLCGTGGIP